MKRTDMLKELEEILKAGHDDYSLFAQPILKTLEKLGMKPPAVDSDRRQVLMQVYVNPSFNMWDEEFDKDEKLVQAYKRRMEKKSGKQ